MGAIFVSHSSQDNTAAQDIAGYLRGLGHTSVFLDFDPANGIPAGRSWEQELYAQLRGCRAVVVLCSPASMASDWCFAEITHAKSLGKHVFPILIAPCTVRPVLTDVQLIDMTTDRDAALQRLARGLQVAGLDATDLFQWDGKRPLYPGLLAFQEEDAALYFGRDAEVQQGLDQLNRLSRYGGARTLLVLGASGSGKSSLVRAGLLPRLRRDGQQWLVAPAMRPFSDPCKELAVALSALYRRLGESRAWAGLHQALTSPADTEGRAQALLDIADDLRTTAGQRQARLLLTVDQFEELLGVRGLPGAARQAADFIAMLQRALAHEGSPLMLIGTLRSDFLGQFQSEPLLADLAYQPLTVGPLSRAGYARIIEGPAEIGGVLLDSGLVQAMVDDTGTNDALPLLAFTLRELYERYGGDKRLQLHEYDAIGRLEGSVARAAEGVMAAAPLSEAEMADLRAAFTAMVRINEAGQFSRRPARWGDLPQRVQPLGERFIEARLLVSMSQGDDRILEVSHEALFRTWAQLRRWLEEDRDSIRLRDGVHQAAEEWAAHGQDAQLLAHRGARLEAAAALMRQPRFEFTAVARRYLEACIAERDQALAAEQARELAKRRRLRLTVASLAAGLVVVAGLGLYAQQRGADAVDAERRAQAEKDTAVKALADLQVEQAKLQAEQKQRITEAFQTGWRALAGLNERSDDETYAVCGAVKGMQGVRRLYCEIANVVSLQTLATLSGLPVFASGPHQRQEGGALAYQYNLRAHQIGRYNPAFVGWLGQHAVPGADNPAFVKNTRALFKDHVQAIALNYHQAYLTVFSPDRRAERLRLGQAFAADLASYTPAMEQARQQAGTGDAWAASPSYKLMEGLGTMVGDNTGLADTPGQSYDQKVAMAFWMRRQLDGTHRAFFDLLRQSLSAYGALPAADLPALDDR